MLTEETPNEETFDDPADEFLLPPIDWSSLTLRPHQTAMYRFCEGPKKRGVNVCGRRTGKTVTAIATIRRELYIPNKTVYYVGPTYDQARNIVWKHLNKAIPKEHIKQKSEKALYLRLLNDSEVFLRSGEAVDSSVGTDLHTLIIDEAGLQGKQVPDLLLPNIGTTHGNLLIITTPRGRDHWTYDFYLRGLRKTPDGRKVNPNWFSSTISTADAGFYPLSLIEEAKEILDERTFNQEYNASFESAGGQIYYAFSNDFFPHGNIDESVELIRDIPIYIGLDFNVDPLCAVLAHKVNNEVHIFNEFYLNNSNTEEFVVKVHKELKERRIIVCPDATGGRRQTSQIAGNTDHTLLQRAGFFLQMDRTRLGHPINPDVLDRIQDVNSALCSQKGIRRVRIHPRCKKLIEALFRQEYKSGTRQPDKTTGYDHINDAFGYLIHQLLPTRKLLNTKARSYSLI